jgi:hypothetical protein
MTDRQDILRRQRDMNRRESAERAALLRTHRLKFGAERKALATLCIAAGGHEWTITRDNELAAELFAADEPPMWCPWCGAHKKPWWMDEGSG